jgi:RNA polymerase sigma-70 factor (family 1)
MIQLLPSDASDDSPSSGPKKELLSGLNTLHTGDTERFIQQTFESDPQKGCELLFRMYYSALCTHAVRFVYSKDVAEDIVSEIFYNFWSTKAYQSVTSSYRAYLFRSVRNRSYNFLSNDLRKSDPLSAADQPKIPESDSPERIMQFDELLTALNQLIASLPPQCQKVFVMNRFEGLKSKEIAEELQISPRTVETHISKALSVLKTGLKNQWPWMALFLFYS